MISQRVVMGQEGEESIKENTYWKGSETLHFSKVYNITYLINVCNFKDVIR